jgi:hypothetical protein
MHDPTQFHMEAGDEEEHPSETGARRAAEADRRVAEMQRRLSDLERRLLAAERRAEENKTGAGQGM